MLCSNSATLVFALSEAIAGVIADVGDMLMQRGFFIGIGLLILATWSLSLVSAREPEPAQTAVNVPVALQSMLKCQSEKDDKVRLACFDARVAAFADAQAKGDVAVVDRADVTKTRRDLFGFKLPDFGLFGEKEQRDGARSEGVDQISAVVRSAMQNADGGWIITLEDGARWEQTQAMTFGRRPRTGSTVTIERAALGSYKMKIDSSPAVRARRIG